MRSMRLATRSIVSKPIATAWRYVIARAGAAPAGRKMVTALITGAGALVVGKFVLCAEYPTRVVKPHVAAKDRILESNSSYEELYRNNSTARERTRSMSAEQYARATVDPNHVLSDEAIRRARSRVLEILGLPSDATLSFADFILIKCWAATPPTELSATLEAFTPPDGRITLGVFMAAVAANANVTMRFEDDCPVLLSYFGADGSGVITKEQAISKATDLRRDMVEQEFRVCDNDNKGYIFVKDVVTTLSPHVKLPSFLLNPTVANRRMSKKEYVAVRQLLDGVQALNQEIAAFGRVDKEVARHDFKRLMTIALGIPATDAITDLMFDIFGRADGVLDRAAFEAGMAPMKDRRPRPSVREIVIENTLTTALAALIAVWWVNPLYKIKNRIQSVPGATLKSVLREMRKEGLWNLYRGVWPQAMGLMPDKVLKFTACELFKNFIRGDREKLTVLEAASAGMMTAGAQSITTVPMERFMTLRQLQTGQGTAPGVLFLIRPVLAKDGIIGALKFAYKGYAATLMRDVPFGAIFFGGQQFIDDHYPKEWNQTFRPYFTGCVLGAAAALVDTPADCIKTAIQGDKYPSNGVFDTICRMKAEAGYSAFTRGWEWRVVTVGMLFLWVNGTREHLKEFWSRDGGAAAVAVRFVSPFDAAVSMSEGAKARSKRER